MRIYYFGELIEDTEAPIQKTETQEQTKLELEVAEPETGGMQSIGDILKEIDMNLDSFRPGYLQKRQAV